MSARAAIQRMADPWRGVSLGGWLLLEPGPSSPLFGEHPDPETEEETRCEWDLMQVLHRSVGAQGAAEVIQRHRERHITKSDFLRIRECGLNAVRLPFGYWVVMGPNKGEPYVGPGLEFVDRAVDWAEECGLQIVLDLHGCPGGESGEAPCGRRQRPEGTWQWQQWNMEQSLKALEIITVRYRSRKCVTGIAVCNEPSNQVPLTRLCQYYDRAVTTIRRAGMPASRVAIVLPVFQRPEDKFAKKWQAMTGGKHKNFCFDVHCYHCFENEFNGKTSAQQLRAVEANAEMLRTYPMVVGEWSLALGQATWNTCGEMKEADVYHIFGLAQLEAFKEATHGYFFWNWTERKDNVEWNYQIALERGLLTGPSPALPQWDGTGEDPLEERFNPSPSEPRVFYGDKVCLRVFYGRYVDVFGSAVNAQWSDKGKWQQFSFCPVASGTGRRQVRHGDVALLRAHNGRYLTLGSDGAISADKVATTSSRFTVHIEHSTSLSHRGIVYLRSKTTGNVVDADEEAEGLFARYADFGGWQQLAVEKPPAAARRGAATDSASTAEKEVPPTPKNRRRAPPLETPAGKRLRVLNKSASLASLSTRAPSRTSSGLSLASSSCSSNRSEKRAA